jgi:hypothetical protein
MRAANAVAFPFGEDRVVEPDWERNEVGSSDKRPSSTPSEVVFQEAETDKDRVPGVYFFRPRSYPFLCPPFHLFLFTLLSRDTELNLLRTPYSSRTRCP